MAKMSKEARQRLVCRKNSKNKTFYTPLKIIFKITMLIIIVFILGYTAFKYGLIPANSIKSGVLNDINSIVPLQKPNAYIPNYKFDYKYWALDYTTNKNTNQSEQTSVSGISIEKKKEITKSTTFSIPLNGDISSSFGIRVHPIRKTSEMHNGIDIKGNHGDPYFAFADGIIYDTGFESTLGNYVRIKHENNLTSHYFHSSKVLVSLNQKVSSGEKIGLVGSTGYALGPHLHFEIRENMEPIDPLNFIILQNLNRH